MERNEQNKILLDLAERHAKRVVLFRNNTGMGWAGKLIENRHGRVVLENARALHAGLVVGSSDLIGWTTVEITPEMVGARVAVFTAVEVKTKRGKATGQQPHFLARVRECGGFAGIARSIEDVSPIVDVLNIRP